jgi:hypothetical protein
MKERGLWFLITTPCLAVGSWLLVLSLLGGSAVGATPDDHAAIRGASATAGIRSAVEAPGFGADSAVATLNPYPCAGVWVTRTVDRAGDVGQYTSLALEPTYPYTPYISYYDVTNDRLKYASLNGAGWFSETVDLGGWHTSIALGPGPVYTPCIAYYDDNGWDFGYACRGATSWMTHTIQHGMRKGLGGLSLALEPTHPYTPHISHFNPSGEIRTLEHTFLSGTVWCSGTWQAEQIEPTPSEAGWWSSLALEPSYPYAPHVSYYDEANGDLRYARKSLTGWLTETVDRAGDVGWYTTLALDSSGSPHISYFDNTNFGVKHARLSGTTWLSETVDGTGHTEVWGAGTSLELDQADAPHICYYNAISGDLKLAYLDGTDWFTQTVDSMGDIGPYCSLDLDADGCPHISYYDATNGDLKYAYVMMNYRLYLPLVVRTGP